MPLARLPHTATLRRLWPCPPQPKRRPPHLPQQETASLKRSIKAVKAREQQLRLEGLTGGKAGKIAASLVTGIKKKKQKKKKVRRLPALCAVCGLVCGRRWRPSALREAAGAPARAGGSHLRAPPV